MTKDNDELMPKNDEKFQYVEVNFPDKGISMSGAIDLRSCERIISITTNAKVDRNHQRPTPTQPSADLSQPKGDVEKLTSYLQYELPRMASRFGNQAMVSRLDGSVAKTRYWKGKEDFCNEIIGLYDKNLEHYPNNTPEKDRVMKQMAEALNECEETLNDVQSYLLELNNTGVDGVDRTINTIKDTKAQFEKLGGVK